jgi:hypothetical protein
LSLNAISFAAADQYELTKFGFHLGGSLLKSPKDYPAGGRLAYAGET